MIDPLKMNQSEVIKYAFLTLAGILCVALGVDHLSHDTMNEIERDAQNFEACIDNIKKSFGSEIKEIPSTLPIIYSGAVRGLAIEYFDDKQPKIVIGDDGIVWGRTSNSAKYPPIWKIVATELADGSWAGPISYRSTSTAVQKCYKKLMGFEVP